MSSHDWNPVTLDRHELILYWAGEVKQSVESEQLPQELWAEKIPPGHFVYVPDDKLLVEELHGS